MQVVENLLVVHNLDEKTTQCYDLKEIPEPLLVPECTVNLTKYKKKYLFELIEAEEKKQADEGYKYVNKPLELSFHQKDDT
jgi:hypothetical protein